MSSFIRPSTADDQTQMIELLARVFRVGRDAPFVDPSLLRWKYWEPRGDWCEPRSFVMETAGRVVAHVGLWPAALDSGNGRKERGVHMIDWAADPQVPGAGVSLLARLKNRYDFVYSIGGSEMTQTILPKFGFRTLTTALTFARPLRPWRQILRHQSRDARLPLRFLRNVWWSRIPGRAGMRHWAARELDVQEWRAAMPKPKRDEGFFQYLWQCPAGRFLGFEILQDKRRAGFFALSLLGEQTCLAGMSLEEPSLERWIIAFRLAQDAALRYGTSCELVARASGDMATAAAVAGMRARKRSPVFLFRRGDGDGTPPLHFQMWDNDSAFLKSHPPEFLT